MMYYSILTSFCLLGVVSSQSVIRLTACVTKDQNLLMNCSFIPKQIGPPLSCVFTMDKKVVASTNTSISVDPTYKNRATVNLMGNTCEMLLKGFSDDVPQTYNCTIYQLNINATLAKTVEKKTTTPCSDGNVLKHSSVILLLASVLPLLGGML